MATVALIQDLFRVLTHRSAESLHGLQAQIYEDFYESLEEAYNHTLQVARSLEDYQAKARPAPDVVICAPFPGEGNPAPGLAFIAELQTVFPGTPIIVWSTRSEASIRQTCLIDLGCAAYYTGTLLDAPDELPDVIADALAR